MIATQELRKLNRHESREFTVTSRRLAEFLESVQAEELLLQQRLNDTESRGRKPKLLILSKQCPSSKEAHTPRDDCKASPDLRVYGSL